MRRALLIFMLLCGGLIAPVTSAVAATVPSAPRSVLAKVAATSASLSWTPPLSTGGSRVTGYVVSHRRVGAYKSFYQTLLPGATGFTFQNLVPGTQVEMTVAARNANGVGPKVAKSVSIPSPPYDGDVLRIADTATRFVDAQGKLHFLLHVTFRCRSGPFQDLGIAFRYALNGTTTDDTSAPGGCYSELLDYSPIVYAPEGSTVPVTVALDIYDYRGGPDGVYELQARQTVLFPR